MESVILNNKKIINRILKSNNSVFAFFRPYEEKQFVNNEDGILHQWKQIYDTVMIINNNYSIKIIYYKWNKGSEEKEFKFEFDEFDFNLKDDIENSLLPPHFFKGDQKNKWLYLPDGNEYKKKYKEELHKRKPELYFNEGRMPEEGELAKFIDLSTFDLKHYYRFLTKGDFVSINFFHEVRGHKGILGTWEVFYKFGLICKAKHYSYKQSDDYFQIQYFVVRADPAYFADKKPKSFMVEISYDPSTVYQNDYPESKKFWSSVFDYFFENKKMILMNFDQMELLPGSMPWKSKNLHHNDKLYLLPKEIIEDSFILTINEQLE